MVTTAQFTQVVNHSATRTYRSASRGIHPGVSEIPTTGRTPHIPARAPPNPIRGATRRVPPDTPPLPGIADRLRRVAPGRRSGPARVAEHPARTTSGRPRRHRHADARAGPDDAPGRSHGHGPPGPGRGWAPARPPRTRWARWARGGLHSAATGLGKRVGPPGAASRRGDRPEAGRHRGRLDSRGGLEHSGHGPLWRQARTRSGAGVFGTCPPDTCGNRRRPSVPEPQSRARPRVGQWEGNRAGIARLLDIRMAEGRRPRRVRATSL